MAAVSLAELIGEALQAAQLDGAPGWSLRRTLLALLCAVALAALLTLIAFTDVL